jgi:type IV pilus assembly protein PilO
MRSIRQERRRFVLMVGVLLAISLGSAAVLLSPMGKAARTGPRRIAELTAELQAKERGNLPLRGIDDKVNAAEQQVASFYRQRLPFSYANISEELGKVAGDHGIQISSGNYGEQPAELPGLQCVLVQVTVTGNYLQVVKFINSLERGKMFFLIDNVSLGHQQASGIVQLNMQLETYLRGMDSRVAEQK